jgi:outer membrane receptor for ferrienterochelin and colicins
MKIKNLQSKKTYLGSCISFILLSAMAGNIQAQQKTAETADVEKIVVIGSPVFRNRTASISPQLEYGGLFFEQFEPTSVGDMLKRTPGISFSSDVGEYDAPQMRGLGEGYTQVLINGKKVPGSASDRAVFVDRIPAEMVDRIQVIRSPSADQDSQGVGGTINIILKDGASFNGGSLKIGGFRADDGTVRANGAFAYGANTDDMSWTLSANFQQRYVNKTKIEQVYKAEGDVDNGFIVGDLFDDQLEIDVRDSDDISLSGSISYDLSATAVIDIQTNYLNTDRSEIQTEDIYNLEDDERELTQDDVSIDEESINFSVVYSDDIGNGSNYELSTSYSNTTDVEDIAKVVRADPADVWEYDAFEFEDTEDTEILLGGFFEHVFENELEFKIGFDISMKDRDETIIEYEFDSGTGVIEGIDLEQTYDAQEDRYDGYLLGSNELSDGVSLELGLRIEHTSRTITAEGASFDSSSTKVNPSAHLSVELNDTSMLRMSIAQTVKRPNFKQLAPIIQIDEPEDGDRKQGNPDLEDEVSRGIDVGYEHAFGKGIIGFNAFYRDITDVIEEGAIGTTEEGGILYSYNNAGDGSVWGLEMDFNVPIGDDTGFFANLTLLDSAIDDQFTGEERRFRDQSDYIYNLGVTHNLPDWETSLGFSYQKQGDSLSVDYHREVELSYDANLELFIEKRFGEGYVVRLTATNLLDAHKIERFTKYDGDSALEVIANHIAGDVDEFELEDESAGRMFTLTLRKSF